MTGGTGAVQEAGQQGKENGVALMLYVLAAVVIVALWGGVTLLIQRRPEVMQLRLVVDVVFGVTVGVIVAVREGPVQGLIAGLVVIPLMVLFSFVRTVQMRHVDRKTRAILDGTPEMRKARRDGVEK